MTRLSYPGESRSRLRSSPACASIEMLRGSGNELLTKEIIDAVKETVGRRIGRLREEKGLSQRELAASANHRFERFDSSPSGSA